MWVVFLPGRKAFKETPFNLDLIEEGSLVDRMTALTREPLWKPKGGLWTCPLITPHSWFDWCNDEEPEWIGKEAILLQVEGVIKCLDPRKTWYDQQLKLDDFDMLAFKLPTHLWHSGGWMGWATWDCDTIWLKNRNVIKRGKVIPIELFEYLMHDIQNDCETWLSFNDKVNLDSKIINAAELYSNSRMNPF